MAIEPNLSGSLWKDKSYMLAKGEEQQTRFYVFQNEYQEIYTMYVQKCIYTFEILE